MKTKIDIPELREFPELQTAAARWYGFDSKLRRYHNLHHALRVVGGVRLLTGDHDPSLFLAALWHDAVYIPGAGVSVNENASAAALNSEYQRSGNITLGRSQVVNSAMNLIRGTSVEHHLSPKNPRSSHQRVLLDADLSSLADSYRLFLHDQRRILLEGGYDPKSTASWIGVSTFLSKLKNSRGCIFRTPKGRYLFERKALFNINWLEAKVAEQHADLYLIGDPDSADT
jgi:predicted metal-dependent HD superfamily phosphohydrolase